MKASLYSDRLLLFVSRFVRLYAYGFLSVQFVLYLAVAGLSDTKIGMLLTLTLLGDAGVSLWLTTRADRIGRRRVLLVGAGLMLLAGLAFATVMPYVTHTDFGIATGAFVILAVAATIGVISPSGNEIGPFLSVEQAALSQLVPEDRRTNVFAWYNLTGSAATALGALTGGALAQALHSDLGMTLFESYQSITVVMRWRDWCWRVCSRS